MILDERDRAGACRSHTFDAGRSPSIDVWPLHVLRPKV